jgi:hypothetical protein
VIVCGMRSLIFICGLSGLRGRREAAYLSGVTVRA